MQSDASISRQIPVRYTCFAVFFAGEENYYANARNSRRCKGIIKNYTLFEQNKTSISELVDVQDIITLAYACCNAKLFLSVDPFCCAYIYPFLFVLWFLIKVLLRATRARLIPNNVIVRRFYHSSIDRSREISRASNKLRMFYDKIFQIHANRRSYSSRWRL